MPIIVINRYYNVFTYELHTEWQRYRQGLIKWYNLSLSRSERVTQAPGIDPTTKKEGTITDCNGKKACGDPNFTAAVCAKKACGTLFCLFLRRGNVANPGDMPDNAKAAVMETPYVSWNHIIKQGYWCMPCCILEDNAHAKMKVCSTMPTQEDICKQQNIHGRCGIEFDPWLSLLAIRIHMTGYNTLI